eukprot:11851046-Heterocapsa_arctica.AAC.1
MHYITERSKEHPREQKEDRSSDPAKGDTKYKPAEITHTVLVVGDPPKQNTVHQPRGFSGGEILQACH